MAKATAAREQTSERDDMSERGRNKGREIKRGQEWKTKNNRIENEQQKHFRCDSNNWRE